MQWPISDKRCPNRGLVNLVVRGSFTPQPDPYLSKPLYL